MKDNRVDIDQLRIEYSVEGSSYSIYSKDYSTVKEEISVSYTDFEEDTVPITIFSQKLSSLQAIVKYLHEKKTLSFAQIARLLQRDQRTIWATYNAVKDKQLEEIPTETLIPVSIFSDRTLSTLETLVFYMLNNGISLKKTAFLLKKNYQTVWTVKQRIARKRGDAV